MTYPAWDAVLRQLRWAVAPPRSQDTDLCLLDRFLQTQDQMAFEALVERHGAMVLGVCRRMLQNLQDAEDAFQATFLVLLRKARYLRRRELLSSWLYGVAYRTALQARSRRARRQRHEKQVAVMPEPPPQSHTMSTDLKPVLDEELYRLPEKYRKPIVLCYLQGKTFAEAAQELGWPAGTVSGRLARARDLLRTRLARRGITVSGNLVAATLASELAAAPVPPKLALAVVRTAVLWIAGQTGWATGLSTTSQELAQDVLRNMFMTKIKIGLAVAIGLGMASAATSWSYQRASAERASPQMVRVPPAIQPDANQPPDVFSVPPLSPEKAKALVEALGVEPKMKQLLLDRHEAIRLSWDARFKEFLAGRGTLDILTEVSANLLKAESALSDRIDDQIIALEAHFERMKRIEEINNLRFNAGRIPIADYADSRYRRLDAEIELEKAKARKKR